jgi:hypothetical protein
LLLALFDNRVQGRFKTVKIELPSKNGSFAFNIGSKGQKFESESTHFEYSW